MSAAREKKPPGPRRREAPLEDFGPAIDREPLPVCPVDRRHPPLVEQPSGTWRCRVCGAERLPLALRRP
jgi:hypothetical protein